MQKQNEERRPVARQTIRVLFLLALFAFLSLFRGIYVDDAYITLSYARTFAESGVWGMHAPFVSNAATSPLNVFLLSALIKLGVPGLWAIYVSECLLVGVIFGTLTLLSRRMFGSELWAYVGTLALFTNPLLISTSGLETYLFIAVLLGCCVAYVLERYWLLGFAAGFLVLARPDGILLLVPLLALMIWEGKRALDFGKVIAGFAMIVGAWGFVSWLYLGSAIPDTYFIKRKEAAWGDISFAKGLALYFVNRPLAMFLSLAAGVFVPFALPLAKTNADWRRFVVLVGGLALLHYTAYSLLGLPPYHWYYGILVGALALIGAGGLVALAAHARGRLTLCLAAVLALGSMAICAEAALAHEQMPTGTNWGTVRQYRGIAEWLNVHMPAAEYRMIGELGIIQYYGRADAVNSFSDRRILRDFAARLPDGSVRKWLADANFTHLALRPPVRSNYLLEENCADSTGALKTWTTSSAWVTSPIAWCLKQTK